VFQRNCCKNNKIEYALLKQQKKKNSDEIAKVIKFVQSFRDRKAG